MSFRTPIKPDFFLFRLSLRNCLSCVLNARIFLLFDLSSAVQNIRFIYLHSNVVTIGNTQQFVRSYRKCYVATCASFCIIKKKMVWLLSARYNDQLEAIDFYHLSVESDIVHQSVKERSRLISCLFLRN